MVGGVRARWCFCWLVYGSPPLTIAPIYRLEGWACRSEGDERQRGIRLGIIEGVPVGVESNGHDGWMKGLSGIPAVPLDHDLDHK